MAWVAVACMPRASVQAHGRFPNANGLVFHPTDTDRWVVRSTRGLMVTTDGGHTWHWMCLEVAEASTFGQEDPAFAMMGDGALVATTGLQGVVRSDPTWCAWTEAVLSDEMRYFVIDQARHPTLPNSTFVVTSSGGSTVNGVYRSDDGGHTWEATSDGGIDAILFESIAVAPSDPEVLYLTAIRPGSSPPEAFVYVSTNGGADWAEPPTGIELLDGEVRPVVAGVDPTDPERVFVRILHNDFVSEPPPERLLLSEDGGVSFTPVHSSPHLRSFAISPDGTTVWVGDDQGGGLWRSTNGGHDYELIGSRQVHCLEWHDGLLWMCTNNSREGFAVATSDDLGDSFTPVFAFDNLQGLFPCPDDTLIETCDAFIICDALPELGLDPDALVPQAGCSGGLADAGGAQDAGEATPDPSGTAGCSCSTSTPTDSQRATGLTALAALLMLLTLRRFRPSRRGARPRPGPRRRRRRSRPGRA
jgi:MYXO-CTERM domain-containing protein